MSHSNGDRITNAELELIIGALDAGLEAHIRAGKLGTSRTVMSISQARRLVDGCRRLNDLERVLGDELVRAAGEMLEGECAESS